MMTVRLLVQKKLTTDLWFSPKVLEPKELLLSWWWKWFRVVKRCFFLGFSWFPFPGRQITVEVTRLFFLSSFNFKMTAVISFLWRFSLFYSNSFLSDGQSTLQIFRLYVTQLFAVCSVSERERESDRESVFQWIMQDGDFLRFFFKTIIAGNFFWPSHLFAQMA